jgi:hypothetical protein
MCPGHTAGHIAYVEDRQPRAAAVLRRHAVLGRLRPAVRRHAGADARLAAAWPRCRRHPGLLHARVHAVQPEVRPRGRTGERERGDLWARVRRAFRCPTSTRTGAQVGAVLRQPARLRAAHDRTRVAATCSTSSKRSSAAACRPTWPCCPSSRAPSTRRPCRWQGLRHVAVHARHGRTSNCGRTCSATTGAIVLASTAPRWTTCRCCTACSATGTWRWRPTTGARAMWQGPGAQPRAPAAHGTTPACACPVETRNYVPKLQAIKNIVASPRPSRLPAAAGEPSRTSWRADRARHRRRTGRRLAGLTLDEFQAAQPADEQAGDPGRGTPQVLLPYDNANRFVRELARIPAPWPAGPPGWPRPP